MKKSLLMNFSVDKENKKIRVEREFNAPVAKVWAAFTESEILDQWWAPKPWRAETKTMNFTEGGYWLYAMVSPEGDKHWARTDFKSISPRKSFSAGDAFCDENGTINHAFPTAIWTNEFEEVSGSTIVNIEIVYGDIADLEKILEMGMKEGFTSALENLDALFAT